MGDFLEAFRSGNLDRIRTLVEAGADVNTIDPKGGENQTLLGLLIRDGAPIELVRLVLERGANPNQPVGTGGEPPLEYAVAMGKADVIPELIARGANPNLLLPGRMPLIQRAILPEIIAALRAGGADMNAKNKAGNTALTQALRSRQSKVNLARIAALLENGADPNMPGGEGMRPLELAVYNRTPKVVIRMLQAGADPNITDTTSGSPIAIALMEAFVTEVEMDGDNWEPYTRAMDQMFVRGLNPDVRGDDGETLVHHLAGYVNAVPGMAMLNVLVRRGVNPNAVDASGMTMLEMAMFLNIPGRDLQNVITRGADPNSISPAGTTLLHRIVARRLEGPWNPASIAIRVKNALTLPGIDVNVRNAQGETALHLAARRNLYEVAEALINAGADVNLRTEGDGGAEGALAADLATDPLVKSLFKGYAGKDRDVMEVIFAELLRDPVNISICPVCASYTLRADGCRYMTHVCKPEERDEELYKLFRGTDPGYVDKIEWCTECGRICDTHHRHYSLAPPTKVRPPLAPIDPSRDPRGRQGGFVHYATDCRPSGGGGLGEKLHRLQSFLQSAEKLQARTGAISVRSAKTATIRDAWNAAVNPPAEDRERFENLAEVYRNPPRAGASEEDVAEWNARVMSLKDFKLNLDVFGPAAAAAPEAAVPEFPRPEADRDLLPIRHEGGPAAAGAGDDNFCGPNFGPHEDGRPTFQFIHRKSDGNVYSHPKDEYICGEDLVNTINAYKFNGKCHIAPDNCDADMHPDEIDALGDQVPADFRQNYRNLFNRYKAGQLEGGKRRKTYRKKGRHTTGRRRMRGGAETLFRKLGEDEYTCGVAF